MESRCLQCGFAMTTSGCDNCERSRRLQTARSVQVNVSPAAHRDIEIIAEVTRLRTFTRRLARFAVDVMERVWTDHGDIEWIDAQEYGEKYGILVEREPQTDEERQTCEDYEATKLYFITDEVREAAGGDDAEGE